MRAVDADAILYTHKLEQKAIGKDWSADDLATAIMTAPTIDAMPVVYGRWLEERPNTYTQKVKCSVCNGSAPFICISADYYGRNMHGDFAKTKYCPCCGAKMDSEQERKRMTDEERRAMTRSNYAAQMEMLGNDASGNPLDMPTVDAVSVEWIREFCEDDISDDQRETIEWMMGIWQREQEDKR